MSQRMWTCKGRRGGDASSGQPVPSAGSGTLSLCTPWSLPAGGPGPCHQFSSISALQHLTEGFEKPNQGNFTFCSVSRMSPLYPTSSEILSSSGPKAGRVGTESWRCPIPPRIWATATPWAPALSSMKRWCQAPRATVGKARGEGSPSTLCHTRTNLP